VITIAFYTKGTPYEAEAELLRASLERVGMEHEITAIADRGDWYANTAQKAGFIRRKRERIKGPILYIDVDAFVHENCAAYFENLGKMGADFGAHWFRGPAKGHDKSKVRTEGWWMLSGTLFFGDTDNARRLLDAWVGLNRLLSGFGVMDGHGQKDLWYLTTCMTDLRIVPLPGRFCYVHDKPWAYPPSEPMIIEHMIASRENRGTSAGHVSPPRRKRIEEMWRILETA
jgi:hypothetical protein